MPLNVTHCGEGHLWSLVAERRRAGSIPVGRPGRGGTAAVGTDSTPVGDSSTSTRGTCSE